MVKLYFKRAMAEQGVLQPPSPPGSLKTARPENNILIIFRPSSRELAGVSSRSAIFDHVKLDV
jgi:hypothetical protein